MVLIGLQYHDFGKTKIQVSDIGMGTWFDSPFIATSYLTRHQMGRNDKLEALKKGLELGINLIDTAEFYQTESIVGDVIEGYDREKLFIAPKSGLITSGITMC